MYHAKTQSLCDAELIVMELNWDKPTAAKECHRRKNGGKANKKKTKTDDAGFYDVKWTLYA